MLKEKGQELIVPGMRILL